MESVVFDDSRQAALAENALLLGAITDSAHDAILVMDPEGRISFWNPAAERIFGYTRSQAMGQDLHRLLAPKQYGEAHRAALPAWHHMGTGAAVGKTIELRAMRKDGREVDVALSLSALQIRGHWHAIGTVRDTTEQQSTARELAAERDNLKAILASSPVGMLLLDKTTVIVDANEALAKIVSRGRDRIVSQRGGGGLGCIHSLETEKGCGFAVACPTCPLRRGIENVLETGASVHGLEMQVTLVINGQEYYPWLRISAEPIVLNNQPHVVVAIDDISDRKAMEEELRLAARTDKLTGLPNRALLHDRLQQAILRSKRLKDYHFAVLFLDFDRFKVINDSLGHDAGDQLLCQISQRLGLAIRVGDSVIRQGQAHTAARLGGDEFVVLLDGIAIPEDAIVVADRLLKALTEPFQLGNNKVYSTASIGIVTSNMPANSAEEVLRDADTAMYEAKLAGKGQYMLFDVSMWQRCQDRLNLENDLRRALEDDELFLMYQPIISLRTGLIEGYEALVRWRHPQRGLISPGEFIPIAEDTGLILAIDQWVLREACGQFVCWQQSLGSAAPPSISVNLSRKQLALPNLPEIIADVLLESGMAAGCLHLEITESAVMKDSAAATEKLKAIKAIGVRLDLDDFGTGYSSLACLHDFPLDVLKIDRSFVANIGRGRDFTALVQAVAQLARNLDIKVVAEGVETAEQALILQSLECEFGQGYLFSRPLMAEQVPQFRIEPAMLPGIAA